MNCFRCPGRHSGKTALSGTRRQLPAGVQCQEGECAVLAGRSYVCPLRLTPLCPCACTPVQRPLSPSCPPLSLPPLLPLLSPASEAVASSANNAMTMCTQVVRTQGAQLAWIACPLPARRSPVQLRVPVAHSSSCVAAFRRVPLCFFAERIDYDGNTWHNTCFKVRN